MKKLKMTVGQAISLLKAAGAADVEIVADEKDASPEAAKTDDLLADIDKARTPIIKPQILQEVKDEVHQATKGTVSGTYKSAIARAFKAAGVTRSELDQFEKVDDLIDHVVGKYSGTMSKDTEALRAEMTEMATKHNAALEKVKGEHAAALKASEDKFVDREIDEALATIVKDIPRTGGNELTQARQVKNHLREQYNLHWDPAKKALELRDKANPELPVFNENKTATIQVKDVTKGFLTDFGVVAKDTRGVDPAKAMEGGAGSQGGNGSGGGRQVDTSGGDVAAHIAYLMGDGQ